MKFCVCPKGVKRVSDLCLEGLWRVSGGCLEGVRIVSGRFLGDVWRLFTGYKEDVPITPMQAWKLELCGCLELVKGV